MTDSETLYIVLVALYLLEGAAWASRGSIALCARSPDWALPRLPHRTIGNARGGAVMGFPFLSSATVFIVPQWPVSFSETGVLFWVAEALELEERAEQPGTYFRYDSISSVSADGSSVLINGTIALEAQSPTIARKIVQLVEQLRSMQKDKRATTIEAFVAELFNVQLAKSRIDEFYRETESLRNASFVLWLVTLVVVPALAMRLGFERIWILALIAVYIPAWITTSLWVRAHHKFFPQEKWERWGHGVLVALVPVSGMRAVDSLARRVLHGFHPAAAVAAIAPQERARRFIGHLLRDVRYPMQPICPTEDVETQESERFYRTIVERQMTKMANGLSFNVEDLAGLPVASGEIEHEMVCPRCRARYAAEMKACEDCGGIELRAAKPAA